MRTTNLFRPFAGSLLLIAAVPLAAGCGGGGAHGEVTVTMKPSELAPVPPPNGGTPPNGVRPPTGEPGRLIGTVTFDGAPPSMAPSVTAAQIKPDEAHVCMPVKIGNESLVVHPENRGVKYVFVYLDKAPARPPQQELEPVTFDNKDCRFVPHGLFVQAGQTMHVHNSDPIAHNTNIRPTRNTPFNQVVQGGGAPLPHVYRRPEQQPVQVKCDFHVWMNAYHLVLDHPWGAVTDENGQFELPELPPGRYQLRIWHERGGFLERSYRVEIDGDTEISLPFAPAKFASFEGPPSTTVYVANR